jgi:hypothetical protein
MPASAGAGLNCGVNLNGAGCSISRAICESLSDPRANEACPERSRTEPALSVVERVGVLSDTPRPASAKAPTSRKDVGKSPWCLQSQSPTLRKPGRDGAASIEVAQTIRRRKSGPARLGQPPAFGLLGGKVLVLNLHLAKKRCSRTAQDISVLTPPSLLSRNHLSNQTTFVPSPNVLNSVQP